MIEILDNLDKQWLLALNNDYSVFWDGIMFDIKKKITWIPLYLLFTQKRVYGQGWPMTLVKYTVIGIAYVYLLALAVALMLLVTLVKA